MVTTSWSKLYSNVIKCLNNYTFYKISCIMRKPTFFICKKTKVQISCADTAQLISAFVFATKIVQSLCFINLKVQASYLAMFCGCTAPLVLNLVGKPKERFCHDATQMKCVLAGQPGL